MNSRSDLPGLYVHIPFCLKKCHYCDFVITTKRAPEDRRRFFNALTLEAEKAAEKYGRLKFGTLYFGGGTPSALEPEEFSTVVKMLKENFDFETGFEFTVEINPGDIGTEKVAAYASAGVNRASVGVQAFQEKLLKDMNRMHGVKEAEETLRMLREAGITNISVDMILNLPGQTLTDVEETARGLTALQPGQISVYDLDVHENTVYGLRRREGRLRLASPEEHHRMAQALGGILEKEGYVQYELSNFARPGFESRHNLVYWHNRPYLGLGPGAFSYMNGVRYQFAASVKTYQEKTEAGNWMPASADRLSAEEMEKETFLTGIRLREGFELTRLSLLRARIEKAAEKWTQNGFMEKEGFRLKFTAQGRFVAESILSEFASA